MRPMVFIELCKRKEKMNKFRHRDDRYMVYYIKQWRSIYTAEKGLRKRRKPCSLAPLLTVEIKGIILFR